MLLSNLLFMALGGLAAAAFIVLCIIFGFLAQDIPSAARSVLRTLQTAGNAANAAGVEPVLEV